MDKWEIYIHKMSFYTHGLVIKITEQQFYNAVYLINNTAYYNNSTFTNNNYITMYKPNIDINEQSINLYPPSAYARQRIAVIIPSISKFLNYRDYSSDSEEVQEDVAVGINAYQKRSKVAFEVSSERKLTTQSEELLVSDDVLEYLECQMESGVKAEEKRKSIYLESIEICVEQSQEHNCMVIAPNLEKYRRNEPSEFEQFSQKQLSKMVASSNKLDESSCDLVENDQLSEKLQTIIGPEKSNNSLTNHNCAHVQEEAIHCDYRIWQRKVSIQDLSEFTTVNANINLNYLGSSAFNDLQLTNRVPFQPCHGAPRCKLQRIQCIDIQKQNRQDQSINGNKQGNQKCKEMKALHRIHQIINSIRVRKNKQTTLLIAQN
ncbi:hypothetical protein FGO68_gene6979 [Halteria grandinella]|uniref:Uncharacterized protein n=1 Tax=Halteria grandinella TaxID=5974 RepID=A0A8J8NEY2_HALGN|nr:hypothetical protein FGO68_gene6979 [Halteria grandinella]